MLKGFVSGEEKDIVRIPIKVGNEYKEGWEVRDNQDRLIWGREDELQTATGTLSFKGYALPVKVKSLLGNAVRNGTPAPDNITIPEMCGVRTGNLFDKNSNTINNNGQTRPGVMVPSGTYSIDNTTNKAVYYRIGNEGTTIQINAERKAESIVASDDLYVWRDNGVRQDGVMLNAGSTALPYEPYGWAEKITCAGQTIPIYLGEVPTVRRIKKLVLTGEERDWVNAAVITSTNAYQNVTAITGYKREAFYCSHMVATTSSESATTHGYIGQRLTLCMDKTLGLDTVDKFKTWLAAQYAAGHPVTVWYVLANEQTVISNEPLCKIGDYADELNDTVATLPEILTTTGQNTLTVDTTLSPSSLTVKGHIKELT